MFVILPTNHAVFAASTQTKYVDIQSGSLTVRSGPGTSYKKIGSLKKHAKVTVYNKTKNGWSEIRYHKKKAYVYNKYLVNINLKNTRVSYTLKDSKKTKYKVYLIASKEQRAKASFNASGWNTVWAGADPGDLLYNGDYKLYVRKNGSNQITYTGYQRKDYIYNKTRHMVYALPAKYKGQPDLFAIGETMSSNYEEAQLFYINNEGKVKKVQTLSYTYRPKITGKNTYQTVGYNNAIGKWHVWNYRLDVANGKFKTTSTKKINAVKSWRKDWK